MPASVVMLQLMTDELIGIAYGAGALVIRNALPIDIGGSLMIVPASSRCTRTGICVAYDDVAR